MIYFDQEDIDFLFFGEITLKKNILHLYYIVFRSNLSDDR